MDQISFDAAQPSFIVIDGRKISVELLARVVSLARAGNSFSLPISTDCPSSNNLEEFSEE